uniref:PAZ domain-containing protein n=1 Tax=Caenorhabditis tropicalis TaxID=1561998 RepID=A0A1I7U805_9PELO
MALNWILILNSSLDATPRNHHFLNMVVPRPPARRRYVSVQRYFEEKYQITLNNPHSPLLRDLKGCLYPIESVWIRIRLL